MRIGQLGMTKGQSSEVKNHGRWLAEDHRRVTEDLGKLLRERGADPATLPKGDDVGKIEGELGALAKTSPQAFDRAYIDFLTRNAQSAVETAGRARDATAGSDADLKWYLDQVERLEIGHRDVARQLASPRAQARAPNAPSATGAPQQAPSAPEQARRRARGTIGR
jgi:predicted outer membrane protein